MTDDEYAEWREHIDETMRRIELTHRELNAINERMALREKRIEEMDLDELRRRVSLMVTQFSVAVRDLGLIRDRLEELREPEDTP